MILIKPEEGKIISEALTECGGLPEEEEVIIMPKGLVIIDVENPLSDVGTQIGGEVYCG